MGDEAHRPSEQCFQETESRLGSGWFVMYNIHACQQMCQYMYRLLNGALAPPCNIGRVPSMYTYTYALALAIGILRV